jgi:citrate lyase beta subunit
VTLAFRSLLFVPGDDPARLRAGFASGADAVVADLEDAVPAARKPAARATVAQLLPELTGAGRVVRVNAPETGLCAADLAAIAALRLDAIVLPKATPDAVASLGADGPPIIAVVETAAGLRAAYETACAPRVAALGLGASDLTADLRLEPRPDALELVYARSKLVVDSVAAGLRGPFDRVFPDFGDREGLIADTRLARSLGFAGKSCTHVSQPAVVNEVFAAARAKKAVLF